MPPFKIENPTIHIISEDQIFLCGIKVGLYIPSESYVSAVRIDLTEVLGRMCPTCRAACDSSAQGAA